ncbi:MAG: chemotaxis response regulator protein-glutamate methylesterase [Lysobacterales bacterium]
MSKKITRVLIVDDSPAMCQFLTEVLSSDPQLEVLGHALDPFEARGMIKTLRPDVLTLDVEMPKMDGITFLKNLMRLRPTPVVMVSSLTAAGAEVTLKALSIGAVDFVVKRHPGGQAELTQYVDDIVTRVRGAATARLHRPSSTRNTARDPNFPQWAKKFRSLGQASPGVEKLIAIGASTGGPEAIRAVLADLNTPNCAVLVSQHMPARFMGAFAARLNRHSSLTVAEARAGDWIRAGHCYVAPGDIHLEICKGAHGLQLKLNDGPACNGHRPSVDVMFKSVARVAGSATFGVLLTGMGRDGAEGMRSIFDAGGLTFAQDQQSSAVWSMPGAAVNLGAVDGVLGLGNVGPTIQQLTGAEVSGQVLESRR